MRLQMPMCFFNEWSETLCDNPMSKLLLKKKVCFEASAVYNAVKMLLPKNECRPMP